MKEIPNKEEIIDNKEDKDLVIVLDIETTGLSPKFSMICEIGLCFLDLETGDIDPIFNIICQEENKKFNDNSWIFQNSDLKYEDIVNAPYLEDFRAELQAIFNLNCPCTAYNQKFDFGFLEFRNFKIHQKFWDPMLKLTPILKIPNISYYAKDYKWPSVLEAYNYFFPNERYIETHRALDDAMHEAKIVYETYKHKGKRTIKKKIKRIGAKVD
ncbi:hypothetical protein ES707_22587 [subsurface metagenome]